jgi:hypothetical protein
MERVLGHRVDVAAHTLREVDGWAGLNGMMFKLKIILVQEN